MPSNYSIEDQNLIERELCEQFSPDWLRETARETGLIARERKIVPVILFWVLAFRLWDISRTLASLKRNYKTSSKKILSDSSWYYRFTPELVAFLREWWA